MFILKTYAPLFTAIQKIVDVIIVLAGTWFIRDIAPPELLRGLALFGSLLTLVIFSVFDVYRSWRKATIAQQLRSVLFSWIAVLVAINLIILFLSNEQQFKLLWPYVLFKAPIFYEWALLIFSGLATVRILTRIFLMIIRRQGHNIRTAVIVGTGIAGQRIGNDLRRDKWMGIRLIGYFDDAAPTGSPVFRYEKQVGAVLGPISECETYILENKVDMLFIALPMSDEKIISRLIQKLGTRGVNVLMVPDLFTVGIQKAKVDYIGNMPLMDLNLFPTWKRTFDIVFSVGIIIVTLPLWILIVLVIKLEDRGPVFYRHPRLMESGKQFMCLKFRTMRVDSDQRLEKMLEENRELRQEWNHNFKLKNDPRVTKVGWLLRRTSLDELPQFINVLLGDMSVVGARPIVPEELRNYYSDTALTYCAMKPGITGPWQTGERNDVCDYRERVEIDRIYVLNCTLATDLKIIGKTIWRMIWPKGAY